MIAANSGTCRAAAAYLRHKRERIPKCLGVTSADPALVHALAGFVCLGVFQSVLRQLFKFYVRHTHGLWKLLAVQHVSFPHAIQINRLLFLPNLLTSNASTGVGVPNPPNAGAGFLLVYATLGFAAV